MAYVSPGGIIVPDASYTGDFSALMRGLLDGSAVGGQGLNTQTIPTFVDYGSLVAQYPNTSTGFTQDVRNTPPFARVYTPGDDFATTYRFDPVVGKWTPTAGFAGMQSALPPSNPDGSLGSYVGLGPGDARGLQAITVPNVGGGQVLVTVSGSAGINFNSEDDVIELVLRVQIGGGGLNEIERVTIPAPKSLTNSGTLPTYSFFVDGGLGFSVQTVYTRIGGTAGTTCVAKSEGRYTNLQYFAQAL